MYLMIRNPGVADYRGFSLIGASTTRYSDKTGTVGQFGSGGKYSVAFLLRNGIRPIVIAGNLKMEFFSKPVIINGVTFNRVCVKYSGTYNGASKTNTEDLGFVLEWGVQDWTKYSMPVREFISNAIDGAIEAGCDYSAVEIDVVDKVRAKSGTTAVFIPYTPEIESTYRSLGTMFLHFSNPKLLNEKFLPKIKPEEDKVLIYKKGVLVSFDPGKSVFDYNLGDDLLLDESRNASAGAVRYAVAKCLCNATADKLSTVIKEVNKNNHIWEGKFDSDYISTSEYADKKTKESRKLAFQTAWRAVAGEKGVVTSGNSSLASFVEKKGFDCVHMPPNWVKILESYDIPSETKVLSNLEQEGNSEGEASKDHLASLDKIWNLFEVFGLTTKPKPECKSFYSLMEAEGQTRGYFVLGGKTIYLHQELTAGPLLDKITLEECVHYQTGAVDGSRDLQDFLFRLITKMAF